jgi:hypothetical protein
MSIYEILPALVLRQSVHAKISIGMHRGVKLKISRIPLIGLETRLGWRTDRKFLRNPNLNEINFQLEFRQNKFKICPRVLAMNYLCSSTEWHPESYNQYLLIQPNDRVCYVLHFCSVIGGCFLLLTFIVCFHFFAVALKYA